MASVAFRLVPPDVEDLVLLRIYEGATADGQFNQIEDVNEIGTYPDYIDNYTTNAAADATDWFAVQWIDSKGAVTPLSAPVKGGTTTLVDEITRRVLERDGSLDLRVVTQEAEAAIEQYLGVDPYTTYDQASFTYRTLTGLTYATLARAQITNLVVSTGEGYTAGLVSQKSDSGGASRDNIEWLIAEANKLLGLSLSFVMLLQDIDPTGLGTVSSISYDQSRLAITLNLE